MRVYKFGGASIATPLRIKELMSIISDGGPSLLLVISALGKTTNALEQVVHFACSGNMAAAMAAAKQLKEQHLEYSRELLKDDYFLETRISLSNYYQELDKAIEKSDAVHFDKSYDSVVCLGEIFSTIIISFFLRQQGFNVEWVDARTVMRTDETYRDAGVNWDFSRQLVQAVIGRKIKQGKIIVTQGFIGSTAAGAPVTLGREGSDYTAAVMAAMLHAESVTIWKDVEGLLNADPKQFADTVKISSITYNEVIEMAYYGAQIIHPKTIKPLQNNNIPLYVKCFLDPSLDGTEIIREVSDRAYPPLIVLKDNQVLLQVTTRDFSFITEDNISRLYAIFHGLKVKVNLIQNAAISFVACIDNSSEKIKALTAALSNDYKVLSNENVQLLTIRHFNAEVVAKLTAGKQLLLKQETRKTLQVVMK